MTEERSLSERIDQIADAFDAALQRGESPGIEGFLRDIPREDRSTVLEELLRIELEVQSERGATIVESDYCSRFPDETEIVRRVVGEIGTAGTEAGKGTVVRDVSMSETMVPGETVSAVGGRRLADYEILEEIARGGMGVVCKARQISLDRLVALKLIKSGEFAGEEEVRRFRNEAEAAGRLDHPNIVPVFDVGEQNGEHFFSMGLVDGRSLETRVKQGPMPPREAATLIRTIAEAVQYAHEKQIIHRDLKPSNVLIDSDGKPRITDFGLAKNIAGDADMTAAGQPLGTPSYMPPEQAAGRIGEIGPAADIYSLGAMLYAMLTGRPPFRAETNFEILTQVLNEDPVPPRQLNPAIDVDLETICLRCLEKAPALRFESAGELAREVERFLSHRPIHSRPIGRLERLRRWCRRNPLGAVVIAMALLLAAGGIVSAVTQRRLADEIQGQKEVVDATVEDLRITNDKLTGSLRAEKAAQAFAKKQTSDALKAKAIAERRLYVGRIQHATSHLEAGRHAEAIRILREIPFGQRGWEHRFLMNWAEGTPLNLIGHRGRVHDVEFAKNGKRIVSGGDTIRVWDAVNGKLLRTINRHATCVAVSPDGRRIAVAGAAGHRDYPVWIFEIASGKLLREFSGHKLRVTTIDYSPDGKHVVTGGDDGTVQLWNVESGQPVLKYQEKGLVKDVAFSPDGRKFAYSSHRAIAIRETTGGRLFRLIRVTGWAAYLDFSPDGTRLAASGLKDAVSIWDLKTGQTIARMNGHTGGVDAVKFSPDGTTIASGSSDRTIKLWDAQSGRELITIRGHAAGVSSIAFSPDGRRIVSGGNDGLVKVWDAARPAMGLTILADSHERVSRLTYSSDGQKIAGSFAELVRVWHARTGSLTTERRKSGQRIRAVAFHPDGKKLVCARFNGLLEIRDAATGRVKLTMRGHRGSADAVAFSPDGTRVVSGGFDSTLRVWNAENGALIKTLPGHRSGITAVAWSPNNGTIASAGNNGEIRLWNVSNLTERRVLKGHRGIVMSLAYRADGHRLASAGSDHTVRVWNLRESAPPQILVGHTDLVGSVAFSRDGRRIVTGSRDTTTRLWDAETTDEILRLQSPRGASALLDLSKAVYNTAFSPNGRFLLRSQVVSTIRDSELQWESRILRGHREPIYGVTFNPRGDQFFSVSRDATICAWDADSGKRQYTLRNPDPPSSIQVTADGRRIIACSNDWNRRPAGADRVANSVIKIWETSAGKLRFEIQGRGLRYAISGDGRRIVSHLGGDRSIKIWNTVTGSGAVLIDNLSAEITGLAISRDGRTVIAGDSTGAILVWGNGKRQPRKLSGHRDRVNQMTFSAQGDRFASVGLDGAVRIWETATGRLERELKGPPKTPFFSVRFADDDQRVVATASWGKQYRWSTESGKPVAGPALPVRSATTLVGGPNVRVLVGTDPRSLLLYRRRNRVDLWREEIERRESTAVLFHASSASRAEAAKNWFAAVFHWKRLLLLDNVPNRAVLLIRLAVARGRLAGMRAVRPPAKAERPERR